MGPVGRKDKVAKAAPGEVNVSPPDRPDYDKGKAAEVIKRLKAGPPRYATCPAGPETRGPFLLKQRATWHVAPTAAAASELVKRGLRAPRGAA